MALVSAKARSDSYTKLVFRYLRLDKDRGEQNWVKGHRDFLELKSFMTGTDVCDPLDSLSLKGSFVMLEKMRLLPKRVSDRGFKNFGCS